MGQIVIQYSITKMTERRKKYDEKKMKHSEVNNPDVKLNVIKKREIEREKNSWSVCVGGREKV